MHDNVIIFGNTGFAELVYSYMVSDGNFNVVAFCVDDEYADSDTFCDLPLIPFSKIKDYSPDKYKFFVAIGYQKLNKIRKKVYLRLKDLGYSFVSYIHSSVILQKNYIIGENCMILEGCIVAMEAKIEDNVFIWARNHIGHHATIKKHSFITANVSIGGYVEVGSECFIGASSTLRDHITVGDKCLIGTGSLVLKNLKNKSAVIARGTKVSDMNTDTIIEMGLNI